MRGVTLQGLGRAGPVHRHAGSDGHALLGIADRGGQKRVDPQFAMILGQGAEGVDGTGNGHGLGSAQRHGRLPTVPERGGAGPGGRAAGPVQGQDVGLAGLGDQDEAIPPDPAHMRLADPQKHGPGDGGIHGGATTFQRFDRDLGRQRMRGGAHPVGGHHGGPTGHLEISHGGTLLLLCWHSRRLAPECNCLKGGGEVQGPDIAHWVGAIKRVMPGEAMQLQPSL